MPYTIPERAGLALLTTQTAYVSGEIQFTLVLINQRNNVLDVSFPTAQQFDFIVSDIKGNKIWQWSDGRTFEPTQHNISVNPQRFHAIDPPDPIDLAKILPAGIKQVVVNAILTSDSLPGMASLTLSIGT